MAVTNFGVEWSNVLLRLVRRRVAWLEVVQNRSSEVVNHGSLDLPNYVTSLAPVNNPAIGTAMTHVELDDAKHTLNLNQDKSKSVVISQTQMAKAAASLPQQATLQLSEEFAFLIDNYIRGVADAAVTSGNTHSVALKKGDVNETSSNQVIGKVRGRKAMVEGLANLMDSREYSNLWDFPVSLMVPEYVKNQIVRYYTIDNPGLRDETIFRQALVDGVMTTFLFGMQVRVYRNTSHNAAYANAAGNNKYPCYMVTEGDALQYAQSIFRVRMMVDEDVDEFNDYVQAHALYGAVSARPAGLAEVNFDLSA